MFSIGFIQGRLSPLVDNKIQAFPWDHWPDEFALADQAKINMMEWTLDQDRIYENPLMTQSGQKQIREQCEKYTFTIPSLTGDCFMQFPFWKSDGALCEVLQRDFLSVIDACSKVGIEMVVVPLVDNGRLENEIQENRLIDFLLQVLPTIGEKNVKIVFESDFLPSELLRFINRLPEEYFGINYDIGNSAALGFDPVEEISTYGHRILNVHIKDRVLGGTTVPLGEGNAAFEVVFSELNKVVYRGNYILQTARAAENNHLEALKQYKIMTESWLKSYAT